MSTTPTYSEIRVYGDDRGDVFEYADGVHFKGFVGRHRRDGLVYEYHFAVNKYESRNHAYAAAIRWLDAISKTVIKTAD